MTYTYDLNTNGCLILRANVEEREAIRAFANSETGEYGCIAVAEVLESLIDNSELGWIAPEECGDLTDAPILGLRDENGKVTARWAFMDYQVRSFLTDLVETGQAIFVS